MHLQGLKLLACIVCHVLLAGFVVAYSEPAVARSWLCFALFPYLILPMFPPAALHKLPPSLLCVLFVQHISVPVPEVVNGVPSPLQLD